MNTLHEFKVGDKLYAIKKLNTRDLREFEIQYAIEVSKLINKGVNTREMLWAKYSDNNGGIFSEKERRSFAKLLERYFELKDKIALNSGRESDNIKREMSDIILEIQRFESMNESIFSYTADTLALNKCIYWLIVHFFYVREGEDWKRIFTHEEYEKNLDYFDEINEGEESDLQKALVRSLIYLGFWVKNKAAAEKDFKNLDDIIDEAQKPEKKEKLEKKEKKPKKEKEIVE